MCKLCKSDLHITHHFQIRGQCLYYKISSTVIYRLINLSDSHFFSYVLVVSKLFELSLQIMQHILGIPTSLNIIQGRSLLSFMEKLIPTINYMFSNNLFCKLYKTDLQIMELFFGLFRFIGTANFEGYSTVTY